MKEVKQKAPTVESGRIVTCLNHPEEHKTAVLVKREVYDDRSPLYLHLMAIFSTRDIFEGISSL